MGVWFRYDGTEVLTDPDTGDIIDETPLIAKAARNAAMLAAWRGGTSLAEIARRFDLSRSWTGRLLKEAGAELPEQRHGVKRRDLDPDTIIREYEDGSSMRALAARHFTSYGTVRRLLLKHGVQLRPHGGQ